MANFFTCTSCMRNNLNFTITCYQLTSTNGGVRDSNLSHFRNGADRNLSYFGASMPFNVSKWVIVRLKCTKFNMGSGFAPNPAGEELSDSQRFLKLPSVNFEWLL